MIIFLIISKELNIVETLNKLDWHSFVAFNPLDSFIIAALDQNGRLCQQTKTVSLRLSWEPSDRLLSSLDTIIITILSWLCYALSSIQHSIIESNHDITVLFSTILSFPFSFPWIATDLLIIIRITYQSWLIPVTSLWNPSLLAFNFDLRGNLRPCDIVYTLQKIM